MIAVLACPWRRRRRFEVDGGGGVCAEDVLRNIPVQVDMSDGQTRLLHACERD